MCTIQECVLTRSVYYPGMCTIQEHGVVRGTEAPLRFILCMYIRTWHAWMTGAEMCVCRSTKIAHSYTTLLNIETVFSQSRTLQMPLPTYICTSTILHTPPPPTAPLLPLKGTMMFHCALLSLTHTTAIFS